MLPSLWNKEEAFPLLGFRRDIDKLFEDFFEERFPAAMWGNGKGHLPPLDVRETYLFVMGPCRPHERS